MYVPAHFEENRTEVLHRVIADHPFGALVTHGADGLDANHLPFELDAARGPLGTLTGHVARANDVCRRVADGDPVLVLFSGPAAYVSPNWYPSKHEAHRQVPTWNYVVVHAHGRIAVRDDERYVRGVVARLTRKHEADEAKPWKMGDSTPDFIDEMLAKIVGIEIAIERLVGKAKLSQNKEERDRANAAAELAGRGEADLAQAMRDATPSSFPRKRQSGDVESATNVAGPAPSRG